MKQAIHHLRTNDPVLSAIIEQVGDYGIQFRPADFETLVKSIVFQQLSGRVASVIFGRLSAAVKGVVTTETILKLRPSRMRSLGLSTQKTAYIRDLARHTRDGKVVFEDLLALPDDEVILRITQVKGIGVWTVHMFLIFALQRSPPKQSSNSAPPTFARWGRPPRSPPTPPPPPATLGMGKWSSRISPPFPTTRSSSASRRRKASASGRG